MRSENNFILIRNRKCPNWHMRLDGVEEEGGVFRS